MPVPMKNFIGVVNPDFIGIALLELKQKFAFFKGLYLSMASSYCCYSFEELTCTGNSLRRPVAF